VYSGHWDHLGFGTPIDGDSICHGASDNASAIAWMFGIAKGFTTGTAPERSVLFLSPTAEESGLLGSTFYVQNPAFSMVKTVAVFNTDVFVFLGRYKDITVTGLGHSELDELLELEAGKLGRYMIADPTPENGMFYRSDQLPFLQAGVPALFAKGYTEAVSLGKEKTAEANIDYWKNVYHKPTDRFIPGVHYVEGVYEDAILFYRLGFKLANSRDFPKWKKSSEFYTEK
jgi:Zn-dependent M28 family amino/carboxypeptidase